MNKNNEHLLPEIIINVVDKFKATRHQNEKLNLQYRLEAIKEYVTEALEDKTTKDVFRGMRNKR